MLRIRAQHRVGRHCLPELVVSDQSRAVCGDIAVQDRLDLISQCYQRAALFGEDQTLEGADIIRVDREEPHVFVHALVHRAVELGERCQVSADLVLLIGGLLQKSLGDHEAHVLASEKDLREAILHASEAVRDVLESAAVEDGFLHASDEAEPQVLCHFADFAQE